VPALSTCHSSGLFKEATLALKNASAKGERNRFAVHTKRMKVNLGFIHFSVY